MDYKTNSEMVAALPMVIDALEAAFVAMGRQGANSDIRHPLRPEWDLARRALMKAGVLA